MTEGTKALGHKVALLRHEVRDLREANEILSRRRRGRKKRLWDGGMMIVEEGHASIDLMDVDSQVMAKSSRRGGQGRSTQLRRTRCGVCDKIGHNARMCQAEIEESGQAYSN
jgi:hypothetical protein